jgi:exodeoxyribonuclease VII large subunit
LVERGYLRIDDQRNRLEAALHRSVRERRHALARVAADLVRVSPEMRVRLESQRLLGLWKRLEAASPVSVLNRGFVILRDDAGRPVMRRESLASGTHVSAEFADGRAPLTAD